MKVIVKGRENSDQLEVFSIEEFVPSEHLLRKIDSAVDFSHIYEIVEDLYCADNGRLSIDPVVIFKMVLIQHLYGLPSLRRTVEEIKMNVAYRWFLGYFMNEQIPHFSTVSYNFKHRYTEKNNRRNILLDIKRNRKGRIFITRSCICRRNAYKSKREFEDSCKKGGAAGGKDLRKAVDGRN